MLKTFTYLLSINLILIAAASVRTDAQTVGGSIGRGQLSRGGSARGVVTMNIPGGLHVNSNRPNSEYAIATSVRLVGAGLKISGVRYPRGTNRKFQFSENLINVYEGRVSFPFTVNIPANYRGSTVRVRAIVRYQACTDEVCYPPKTKEVTLSARVN